MIPKTDFTNSFESLNDKIWINTAHQGILPKPAVDEGYEAIEWKKHPYEMTSERFKDIPELLKKQLGKLIDVPPEDIILANSSSYGLHLLANGIQWQEGDEIILVKGDFPSTILPWLYLQKKGVKIRYIRPGNDGVTVDHLKPLTNSNTRLFCTNWVHSFTGFRIDEQAMGAFCRDRKIISVLNCSQGIGAIPFNASRSAIDAVTSVGFKWLCGPYGTGFCWIRPDLRESMEYNQAYWLSMQTAEDLEEEQQPEIRDNLGAKKYDLFGTANFFNFKPWNAALHYILKAGINRIEAHDKYLVDLFIEGLDRSKYNILSPEKDSEKSTLIFISHKNREQNKLIYNTLVEEGIYGSLRMGNLRFSPHLYNTKDEINNALHVINAL